MNVRLISVSMAFKCSRCNSFEDASMLLEELRLFDNQVYGVAHGLLMGYRDNVWVNAQSLFDEVKQMDCSTASAFYNALTDMLWHYGQVSFSNCCLLSFFQCTSFSLWRIQFNFEMFSIWKVFI